MAEVIPAGAITIGLTGADEIIQNVRVILATPKGSVPLDREFGVDMSFLDLPRPLAMAQMRQEIVQAVHRFEPRARVRTVVFDSDADGRLIPRVTIDIQES